MTGKAPMRDDDWAATVLLNPGFLLSHLGRRARREFVDALRDRHLQPPHYGVLLALQHHDGETQRGLSDLLGVDRSAMVDLIDTLEHEGLVQRTRDSADRRRNAIRQTAAGRLALEDIGQLAVELNDRFFAPLHPDERRQLLQLLEKLYRAYSGAVSRESAAERE